MSAVFDTINFEDAGKNLLRIAFVNFILVACSATMVVVGAAVRLLSALALRILA